MVVANVVDSESDRVVDGDVDLAVVGRTEGDVADGGGSGVVVTVAVDSTTFLLIVVVERAVVGACDRVVSSVALAVDCRKEVSIRREGDVRGAAVTE